MQINQGLDSICRYLGNGNAARWRPEAEDDVAVDLDQVPSIGLLMTLQYWKRIDKDRETCDGETSSSWTSLLLAASFSIVSGSF
jgi:hypothetical protein